MKGRIIVSTYGAVDHQNCAGDCGEILADGVYVCSIRKRRQAVYIAIQMGLASSRPWSNIAVVLRTFEGQDLGLWGTSLDARCVLRWVTRIGPNLTTEVVTANSRRRAAQR